MTHIDSCPCGSTYPFSSCCEPLISGRRKASTAEALMRSRYTAYVVRNVDYLLETWHPTTRPADIDSGTIPQWHSLHIVKTEAGDDRHSSGTVEFKAVALSRGKTLQLHENSRFVKEHDRWYYVDGDVKGDKSPVSRQRKVGRNEPCPCDSGRKFKKCCGA
jgi:SEC-C motif-containing protein